ncbi:F-box protein [Quillaja saponaria]|uniref:F-box protein n=1 Tax=Quillaja saponaria TaxID=32244 RepID=A0AAD7PWP4_QUISA|nr:F-box protein [Quillaja saponaria]KAJ7969556.1 F-box protein [Quillaja saponaria]
MTMDCKEQFREYTKDRISDLPDDVLSYILSKLTIKDLLKTRILSKRWLNLWESRRNLNFDIPNMFGSAREMLNFNTLPDMPESNTKELVMQRVRNEFVRRVDQFIQHFQGEKIDSFRLAFDLPAEHINANMDRWLSVAVAKGVEGIDLLFSNKPHFIDDRKISVKEYEFPFNLFSESDGPTLRHLSLKSSILDHPPPDFDFVRFRNLRSLVLEETTLPDDFPACLLSRCSFLEELSLRYCYFTNRTSIIVGPSLRSLEIIILPYGVKFHISASNITYLKYSGALSDISFIEAPQLITSYFHAFYEREIPCVLPQFANFIRLENLALSFMLYKVVSLQRSSSSLKNLKQLDLFIERPEWQKFDPFWILNILRACPLLQKFSLMFLRPKPCVNMREESDPGAFTHNKLKVIEIGGCVGNWYEAEFVKYLVKHVKALESITLSPFWRDYGKSEMGDADISSWVQSGREMVRGILREEVSEQTHLRLL